MYHVILYTPDERYNRSPYYIVSSDTITDGQQIIHGGGHHKIKHIYGITKGLREYEFLASTDTLEELQTTYPEAFI